MYETQNEKTLQATMNHIVCYHAMLQHAPLAITSCYHQHSGSFSPGNADTFSVELQSTNTSTWLAYQVKYTVSIH